ncbi:hypothetical protein OF83DRAFT_1018093, partial [Amylostereum chailletii]
AIYIFRDQYKGKHPLLPWKLGTSGCEHVFGASRQIVTDFNALDFQYMIRKLHVRLREDHLFNEGSDGKARASGYNHTYQDDGDIDLLALSTFPSNDKINEIAIAAYGEASSLWDLLGV